MFQQKYTMLLFILCGFLMSCGENTGLSRQGTNSAQNNAQLSLKLNGLEPMQGQHYEGWIIADSGVVTTGRFNIDDQGNVYNVNAKGERLSLAGDSNNSVFDLSILKSEANTFVLTIEPDNDVDDGPSSVHYVGGAFDSNGDTVATVDHGTAIGTSFSGSAGSYILATPTNGPSTHNQGIWFLQDGAASLNLPSLATGWAYEGWIVNTTTGEVRSTGTFFSANGADSDGGGAAAGPNPAPPFPGQDFIDPALILNSGNYATVISVEPFPDFDPAPFTIKILAHDILQDAAVTTSFDLNNIANDAAITIEASVD